MLPIAASREAVITHKGKAMTDLLDAARDRIGRAVFAGWDAHDIDELVRLMRKFADLRSRPILRMVHEADRPRTTVPPQFLN